LEEGFEEKHFLRNEFFKKIIASIHIEELQHEPKRKANSKINSGINNKRHS
jgi:hypothetical protein